MEYFRSKKLDDFLNEGTFTLTSFVQKGEVIFKCNKYRVSAKPWFVYGNMNFYDRFLLSELAKKFKVTN